MKIITFCFIKLFIFSLLGSGLISCYEDTNFLVWGPGLQPHIVTTPARYFFIEALDKNQKRYHIFDLFIKFAGILNKS